MMLIETNVIGCMGNNSLRDGFFGFLSLVLIACSSAPAFAATQAELDTMRHNALAYLFLTQDPDGYWDGPGATDIQTTSRVLHAFTSNGIQQGLAYELALSWLANSHPSSNTALASKAGALGSAGWDVADELQALIAAKNGFYEAWGSYPGYQPSMPDSAIAHDAWYLAGQSHPNGSNASAYIRNTAQNSDGGWPYMVRTLIGPVSASSSLIPTAYGVITTSRSMLLGFGGDADITEGINWLTTRQLADGGFSDDTSATTGNAFETALVMLAIKTGQQAGNSAANAATSVVASAEDFLVASQAINGAWGDDVIATATVLQAMANTTLVDGDTDGIPDTVEPIVGTDALIADARSLLQGIGDGVIDVTVASQFSINATAGAAFDTQLPFVGGGTPVAFLMSGGLPQGLVLNAMTGQLTGTPLVSGDHPVSYTVLFDDGSEESHLIMLTVNPSPLQIPVPWWAIALLAVCFVGLFSSSKRAAARPMAVVLLVGLSVQSLDVLASEQSLNAGASENRQALPEKTVQRLTDAFVGHPGERDESVRSINDHINALSIAINDDNSIEARKMFSKTHATALKTLNQRLNDELSGKRKRRYLRNGDTPLTFSAKDIAAKDASVQGLLDDVAGLLSVDGEEALAAFSSIRKRLDSYNENHFDRVPALNWTHLSGPGKTIVLPASDSVPAYLAKGQRDWKNSAIAFNGDGMLLAAAPSTPTEASSCSYSSADLADDGKDVTLTPAIHAKAEALDYSPVDIFEFVANEIEFLPYYGAMKGAHATLLSRSGSATDQSSLLIALLRASNIPARYVRGEIAEHIGAVSEKDARVVKWLQVESLLAAATRLERNGNPTAFYTPNNILGFSHVWVEACVPYAHYQGAQFDQKGHRWIPLDPSLEIRSYKDGIENSASFDLDDYLNGFKRRMPEEEYEAIANEAIVETDKDVNDIGYQSTRHKIEIDILPASLPYNVLQFTDWSNSGTPETAELPDSHRYFLHIDTLDKDNVDLGASISVPIHEVVLDRVTLFYQGATAADEAAMQNWRLNGGNAPDTLDLVPVIRINGIDRSTGTVSVKSNTFSNKVNMWVTMDEHGYPVPNRPNCPAVTGSPLVNDACFDTVRAPNYHSLQVWAYQGTPEILSSMAQQLVGHVNASAQIGNNIESTLGNFLHYISLNYMTDISEAAQRIGRLDGTTGDSGIHMGLTGSQSYVDKVLDIPFGILKTGFYVDVPGAQSKNFAIDSAEPDFNAFLLGGYAISAYESQVWQESARLDAISTVRGIQLSNEQGFDVLTIDSANQVTELPNLIAVDNGQSGSAAYPPGFIQYLKDNYLDNGVTDHGFTLKIPDRQINYEGWVGSTFIGSKYVQDSDPVEPGDQTLFSATFPIIGDYASASGGYTVSNPITYNYDPFSIYDTGYFGGNTTSILNGGVVSGGSSSSFDLNPAIFQSDYGAVGNGGGPTNTFAGDPVNLVTGNFYHSETDLSIPHRDLPFVFERIYNSREPIDGPLGFGWTHSFNHKLSFVDEEPDNEADTNDTDGITSSVIWGDGTGGEKRIEVSGATASGVNASTIFTRRAGQYFAFVRETDGSFTITEKNGLIYRFESSPGDVDDIARLTQIESRNGNTLTLSYTGTNGDELDRVTDSTGRFIEFTYNNNRISRMEDWTGRAHQYEYDADGNLQYYRNPLALAGEQNPVEYDYYTAADSSVIDHAIKSITLPKGNGMTFEYYVDGRVASHTNTAGETFSFLYNDFRRETVVTDARGFSKQYFFNEYGNPIEIIDEEGGISKYEYNDPSGDPYLRTAVVNEARLRTEYEYNNNGTLVLEHRPSGNTIAYSDFNVFQQPGKVKDLNGNYRLIKYDAEGNVTDTIALKDGIGAGIDPASYVPVAADILSWTKNTYDSVGNLESTTQVRDVAAIEGFKQSWLYDANNLYATQVERCGDKNGDGIIDAVNDPCDVATLVHDALGRIEQGVNARFEQTEYRYDALDRVVRGTDRLGKIRDYGYDDNGNPDSEVLAGTTLAGQFHNRLIDDNPSGTIYELVDSSSSRFDESDRLRVSIDAGGNATYYSYDAMGNLATVTNPDNYTIAFDYDGLGRVVSAFDGEGREAKRDIDPIGRMRSLTDPNGNSETFRYYDAANDGRLEQRCEAPASATETARCTRFAYDNNGNVTTITDNAGNTTLTFYDALNRPVRILEPAYTDAVLGLVRPVTQYSYDLLGNITRIDAGHNTDIATGLAASDVFPASAQTVRVYDDWGRVLSDTDALGETRLYTYNLHGDLITEQIPFITLTAAIGSDDLTPRTITRAYAYGGLLTQENDLTYHYNAMGQLTQVSGRFLPVSNTSLLPTYLNRHTYTYDSAHRLQSESDGTMTYTYTTSPGGLLEKVAIQRGGATDDIHYRYDKTGRLQTISYNDSEHVSYVFDDAGRLTQKHYPGNVKQRFSYFDDNRLKQLLVNGTSTVLQQDFTYDTLGRRDTLVENLNGTATNSAYSYDALSRLTSETLGGQTQSFTYDRFSNRVTHTRFDGSSDFYEYDAAQQLKAIRDTNSSGTVEARFQYSPNGDLFRACEGVSAANVTADVSLRGECDLRDYQAFIYDEFGQLRQASSYAVPAGLTHHFFESPSVQTSFEQFNTQYTYDYQHRRMQVSGFTRSGVEQNANGDWIWSQVDKDVYNTQHRYLGEAIYLSYNTGQNVANPEARWLHGAGMDEPLISYGSDGSVTNYHQDGRNSAVLTTNANTGAVVASQQFDAFGVQVHSNGVIPQYGFTGREPSAEGLMYYRARYYNPRHGRFTQRDPLGFVDGVNRYAYVRNNPVNRIDPTGTVSQSTNNFSSLNTNYFSGGGSSSQALFNTSSGFDPFATASLTSSVGGNTGFIAELEQQRVRTKTINTISTGIIPDISVSPPTTVDTFGDIPACCVEAGIKNSQNIETIFEIPILIKKQKTTFETEFLFEPGPSCPANTSCSPTNVRERTIDIEKTLDAIRGNTPFDGLFELYR